MNEKPDQAGAQTMGMNKSTKAVEKGPGKNNGAGAPGAAVPGRVLGDPKSLNPEELIAKEKEWQADMDRMERIKLAHRLAEALLQNPKIDTFLFGSPLDPGVRGDAPNAGALLAQGTKRLAEDYLAALDALHAPKTKTPEPMTVGEVAEVAAQNDHPTDDFPLD